MLELRSLSVWYGAAQALFDVSLQVRPAEMVVLQGLNGAGKSTLLQGVMGMSPRCAGAVFLEGHDLSRWPSDARARAGLGYVAENRRLFGALSVEDNLMIAARGDVAANRALVLDLFPALRGMLGRLAGQMSGGEQQMLALARTLMTSPRLLLLDEPCEGIAPVLVQSITDALLALKSRGMAMLVAEQNQVLASRADRLLQLQGGRLA